MEILTNEILNQTIGEMSDRTRNKIASQDKIYQQDEKDLEELAQRYIELDLPKRG